MLAARHRGSDADSATSRSKQARVPSSNYDGRLALLLVPCILLLLLSGGKVYAGLIVVGIILCYLFDSAGFKEGSLVTFWLTMVVCMVWYAVQSITTGRRSGMITVLLLLNVSGFKLLVAAWWSQHSDYLQREEPGILIKLEQILLSSAALPSTVLIMTAIISMVGVNNAPYFLCAVLYFAYRVTMTPTLSKHSRAVQQKRRRPSAQHAAGAIAGAADTDSSAGTASGGSDFVVGSVAAVVHTLVFVGLPFLFYLAVHHRRLFTALGFSDGLLLLTIPALLLLSLAPLDVLWWTGYTPQQIQNHRALILVPIALVATAALEYRVVIYAFSPFLYFHTTAPLLSLALVTVTMYAGLFAAILAILGFKRTGQREENATRRNAFTVLVHISALTGAASLGLPLYLLPFVLVASHTAVNFFFEQKLAHYLIFVCAFSVALVWFIGKSFWFLKVDFGARLPIQTVAIFLTMMFVLALIVPGLTLLNMSAGLTGMLMFFHAAGLSFMESTLTRQNARFDTDAYGFYLVVFTSIVGLAATYRLAGEFKLTPRWNWLLTSVYLGKLSILLSTGPVEMLHYILLCAALLAPFLMYKTSDPMRQQMSRRRGLIHAAAIAGAVFWSRKRLIASALLLLLRAKPSNALVLASFFVCTGVAWMPLTILHFGHSLALRRANTIFVALACLFAFIQPSTDIVSTAAVGRGLSGVLEGAQWPNWLLFIALALIVVALGSVLPLPRVVFALLLGSCLGLYVCGVYLPMHPLLYALFVATFNLVSVCAVYIIWPTLSSGAILSAAYGLFVALLPVTYFVEGEIFAFAPRRRGLDFLTLTRIALLAVHASMNFVIALCVKMKRQSLQHQSERAAKFRSASYVQNKSSSTLPISTEVYISNIAAPLALLLGLVLNLSYFKGSVTSILFLSPILLLLNQDNGLLRELTEERRYFPIVAATSAFLVFSVAYELGIKYLLGVLSLIPRVAALPMTWFDWTKNAALLLCTLPSQEKLLRFMWGFHRFNDFALWCIAPLNLLPLTMGGDYPALQLLGLVGLIGALLQLHAAHTVRRQGMSVI